MREIYICVGSACHAKGSYDVIHKLQDLVKKEQMKDKVEIKAAFCLGECTSAVSVKTDDGLIHSVQKENVDAFFYEKFLGKK